MGRKSKLNEKQWAEVQRRLLDGEAIRALAREFDVSEGSIRAQKSKRVETIKAVAKQVVETECAIKKLDFDAQCAVNDYASRLRSISSNILSAAHSGSIVSAKMAKIAEMQAEKINEDDPMESQEQLQAISALNKLGIDAASIGLNLMKLSAESPLLKDTDKKERKSYSITLAVKDASEDAE
jgi:transposase-like protein